MISGKRSPSDISSISPLVALRVGRALIDGATPAWAAERFGLSIEDVTEAWDYTRGALTRHFSEYDPDFSTIEAYLDEQLSAVLSLLVFWIDLLSRPSIASSRLTEPTDTHPGQKKCTSQGETEH